MNPPSFRGVATAVFLLLAAVAGAHGQEARTPEAGSPERKAIMDALRAPFERALGQPVIFAVSLLKVSEGWAAVRVQPKTPSGGEIDYRRTKYRKQLEEDMFDPTGEALLRRQGASGPWRIIEWKFGGTDTALSAWVNSHGAPQSLNAID